MVMLVLDSILNVGEWDILICALHMISFLLLLLLLLLFLFLFEAGLSSINVFNAAFLEFENLSNFEANPSKCLFYYFGISNRVKHVLLDELIMKEGHLLVRYLRAPLISYRLSSVDYGALLNRTSGHIDSWLSKNLSYADRLQLLSSALYSLQVYWMGIFILPKKIIKAIEQKFNRGKKKV